MRNKKIFLLIALLIASANTQTNWEIVTSNKNELVINLQANIKSSEDLKPIELLVGLPDASLPQIKIQGVKNLKKTNHEIIPDRIVAGTFLIAGIMLKSKFTIDIIFIAKAF